VKRARELIYTAKRQASRDVGLAGLRLKPGSSQLYVAILQVKTLVRLMFKSSFDYNRFTGVNTVVLDDRELDHVCRIV
jgi:hypothetical protein